MPVHDEGAPSSAYAPANGTLRKEINNELAGQVTNLDQVTREANSIFTSDNFHLDSRLVGERWKIEIQYVKGKGQYSQKTVAVVLVQTNATSVADFQTAVRRALLENKVFRVS